MRGAAHRCGCCFPTTGCPTGASATGDCCLRLLASVRSASHPYCLQTMRSTQNTCELHAEGGDLCGRCPAFCLPRMCK